MNSYSVRLNAPANAYIGRWHNVRLYGNQSISHPYIFDRKNGHLSPYSYDEWVYDDTSESYYKTIRGGVGWSSRIQHPRMIFQPYSTNLTAQTYAIDSAYTYGSAGKAVAARYRGEAKTLSAIYYYIISKTGTVPGNDLDWEIRDDSSNTKPGSNIQSGGSGTIDITSASNAWISAASLSVSLSADTSYWACIADKSAVDASNFATVSRGDNVFTFYDSQGNDGVESTNGFSTTTTNARVMNIVWVFSDNTAIGSPFLNFTSNATSDRRGIYFSSGFTESIKFYAMTNGSAVTNLSGIEIYDSSATVPGTGALSIGSTSPMYASSGIPGYYLSTPYTFEKSTGYRVVFTFSGISNTIQYYFMGNGGDSNLALAMLGGGGWYWTRANGTTDWSNDITTGFPRLTFILENQVEIASSGSGLLIHPGMTGGIRG